MIDKKLQSELIQIKIILFLIPIIAITIISAYYFHYPRIIANSIFIKSIQPWQIKLIIGFLILSPFFILILTPEFYTSLFKVIRFFYLLATKNRLPLPTSKNKISQIYIGKSWKGKVYWNISKSPHIALSIQTGGGKTNLIRHIIVEILNNQKTKVVIFDVKPHSYNSIRSSRLYTSWKLEEILKSIENLVVYMEDVYNQISKYGKRILDDIQQVFVVIEELNTLNELFRSESKTMYDNFQKYVSRLIFLGREVEIHILVSAQRLTADVLGSGNNENARSNFSSLILKQPTANTWRMLVGSDIEKPLITNNKFDSYYIDYQGSVYQLQLAFLYDTDNIILSEDKIVNPEDYNNNNFNHKEEEEEKKNSIIEDNISIEVRSKKERGKRDKKEIEKSSIEIPIKMDKNDRLEEQLEFLRKNIGKQFKDGFTFSQAHQKFRDIKPIYQDKIRISKKDFKKLIDNLVEEKLLEKKEEFSINQKGSRQKEMIMYYTNTSKPKDYLVI